MLILDLPICNGPLGMENGKISDSQITASSFLSPTNQPTEARFRHSGSWCPAKPQKVSKAHIRIITSSTVIPILFYSGSGIRS